MKKGSTAKTAETEEQQECFPHGQQKTRPYGTLHRRGLLGDSRRVQGFLDKCVVGGSTHLDQSGLE